MAIIDLDTGEYIDKTPPQPMPHQPLQQAQEVQQPSGIIDLDTGEYVNKQTPAQYKEPLPPSRAPEQPQASDTLDRYKNLLVRRANKEEGLDDEINSLYNTLNEQRQQQEPRKPYESGEKLPESGGFYTDIITGADRMTPEMENLPSLGSAPEMSEMSWKSLKANLGTFTTGDPEELKKIFKKQYGDKVSFTKDEKQNIIVNFPSGSYPMNKPGLSMQDAPHFIGETLAMSPAAKAKTFLGAVGASAAGEAILEGVDEALGGDFSIKDVGISAAFGAGGKLFEDAISSAYRFMKGTPDGDGLLKAADEAGIKIMTTDAVPPENIVGKMAQQTTEKIPIAGTGGLRAAQQRERVDAVTDLIDEYGTFSYKSVVDSLRESKNRIKKAAGNVLNDTGETLDSFGDIPLTKTDDAILDALDLLEKPGVIKSTGAMADLDTLVRAMDEAPQTFTSLKENRTAFREIVAGADKAERSQLTSRSKNILESVEKSMTADMKAFAKDNLSDQRYNQWKKANHVYASEAKKMTKTKLKNILDTGDLTPEAVEKMLFSKKPSELKMLYSSIGNEGRQNARSAIVSKIADKLSRRVHGITPNSFATELKKNKDQIDAFFKGADKKRLEGLGKVLDATRRAQDAAATSVSGQQAIGGAAVASVIADPVKAILVGGSIGLSARFYESKPVRNILYKMASVPAGSTAFLKLNERLNFHARLFSQNIKDESTKEEVNQ